MKSSNFFRRIFSRKKAYLELVEQDIEFSFIVEKWFDKEMKLQKITLNDLKEGERALKSHISRNTERVVFLIGLISIFTISLIFIKFGILPFGPLLKPFIVFMGFFVLFTLNERTKHIEIKHSMEEFLLYLESRVKDIE